MQRTQPKTKTTARTETSSQTLKNLWIPKGTGRRDGMGVWDWHRHTELYRVTSQWGPAVEHRELYPIFCDNLCGEKNLKKNGYVYMYNKVTLLYSRKLSHYKSIILQ